MGDVVFLPKHCKATRDQAIALRELARDLDIPDEARHILDNALFKITDKPSKRWTFVMINQQQFRFVAQAISERPDAGKTLMVWNCAMTYARMDTGEILASREQLAKDARTLPRHVSTAMGELVKIGALLRKRIGRHVIYSINPNVGWAGGEGTRQEAAEFVAPVKLRLVPKEPEQLELEDAINSTEP